MSVILLCGYRRTGKDTLVKIVNDNIEHDKYLIFAKEYANYPFLFTKYNQMAFATELKKEVSEHFNIPYDIPDEEKDKPLYNSKSARDLYIYWGDYRRSSNPDYWVDKVITNINQPTIITDCRFKNEVKKIKENFNTLSIRLFRKDVPIPTSNIQSEHELDELLTDYLFVTENSYNDALNIFPQYHSYVKIGEL